MLGLVSPGHSQPARVIICMAPVWAESELTVLSYKLYRAAPEYKSKLMLDVDVGMPICYSLLFNSQAWENELFLKYMHIRNKDPYWESSLKKLS